MANRKVRNHDQKSLILIMKGKKMNRRPKLQRSLKENLSTQVETKELMIEEGKTFLTPLTLLTTNEMIIAVTVNFNQISMKSWLVVAKERQDAESAVTSA